LHRAQVVQSGSKNSGEAIGAQRHSSDDIIQSSACPVSEKKRYFKFN